MTIDNKLVISVFGPDALVGAFGSVEGVKTEFDYVEQVAKDMGFDGCIFMACYGGTDQSVLTRYKSMGFDAVHAYNWGGNGKSASATQGYIAAQVNTGIIHNVPTVSTGFNNLAWAYTRSSNITVDNFKQILGWVKDKALPFYKDEDESWMSKFMMLSTWNEYGEGTYMMPAGLNGFGYLDAIRDTFTKSTSHEDPVPDNKQLERINHLYPINRELIRPQGYYTTPDYKELLGTMNFADGDTVKPEWNYAEGSATAKDGIVSFTAVGADPRIQYKTELDIDANTIKQIKVYVDGPVGESVSVYFITSTDKGWSQSKCAGAEITKEGLNAVTVSVGSNSAWTGKVVGLRVDAVNSKSDFKIQKLEFYGTSKTNVYRINNKVLDLVMEPVETENDVLIPFFPDDGIGYQLGCYYTWDKTGKKLSISAKGHDIVYTMSSNIASIDGQYVKLADAPYLEDGIPMIPLKFTVETLGYTFTTTTENDVVYNDLITVDAEHIDAIMSREENKWEFNIPGDMETWSVQNGSAYVTDDGCLYGSSLEKGKPDGTFDMAFGSPQIGFDASNYSKLVIRMKYDVKTPLNETTSGKFTLGVYFKANGGGLAEARRINLPVDQTSDGEFVTFTFDMAAHEQWKGQVTGIRVDPTDAEGEFWIDYIRFEK